MDFPTLIGSIGGWVFVVDVTRGSVGNFIYITSVHIHHIRANWGCTSLEKNRSSMLGKVYI